MIGFINTQLVTTGNYNANAYKLYKPLEHAKFSQSSLVASWQRSYNSLTVTAAHYEVFFLQLNSFLDVS
jgi:hypothetical protein